MNITFKKTLASFLTVAMLATGTTLLTSCKSSTAATDTTAAAAVTSADSTDSPAVLTQDAGAADATAAATTAAPVVLPAVATGTLTIDGKTVSAAEYDFYYYLIYNNAFMQYASYGLVPTIAADSSYDLASACSLPGFESMTWADYIKKAALKEMQDTYILLDYANKAGMTISATNQTEIDSFYSRVQTQADGFGLTLDQYLTTMYGEKMTKTDFDQIISRFLLASQYRTDLVKEYTFTDAEMQTFYTANKDSYKDIDIPTVRHILFLAPAGAPGYTDATAEELAAAKALAESTLAKIKTYDDMVSIGDAAFADSSALESAEYSVAVGSMVASFEDWCYDAARKPGDTGIVQSEYGYHVMYYVKTQKDWVADAIASLTTDKFAAYITEQEALPQFAVTQN